MLAAGRRLSPALRSAALDTSAAAAKAAGADALDDPPISDSYQYYRNPNVFSGHAIVVIQAFPLWGKLDLRREAALADLDAARGCEQAARCPRKPALSIFAIGRFKWQPPLMLSLLCHEISPSAHAILGSQPMLDAWLKQAAHLTERCRRAGDGTQGSSRDDAVNAVIIQ